MTIDANTGFLLDCDGPDASTTFTDTGVNAITPINAIGNAAVSTDQFKFSAGGSLWIPDGTSKLEVADHSVWDFLTNNNQPFTLDMWVYFTNITAHRGFMGQFGSYSHYWTFHWTSGGNLYFKGTKSFQNQSWSALWMPTINTWHHIAAARDASNNRFLFADGVPLSLASEQKSTQWSSGVSNVVTVGYVQGSNYYHRGYIDEVRFSDVDRYGSGTPFTPETIPYGEVPPPPPPEQFFPDKYFIPPRNPVIKKIRINPGHSFTPGMEIPVPIKLDKWEHIKNIPSRTKKRNVANVTQNILVEFNVPTLPEVIMDSWFKQQQLARIAKRSHPSALIDIDFIEAIQEQNGNYFDTGVFGFAITENGDDAADFADADVFDMAITAVHLEDFQLEDVEPFGFAISYPIQGVEIFNSGVPGFVSANVTINGVNQSANMQGLVSVTREDNTAARFKCTIELDPTAIPPVKPSEMINKEVLISFAAADMDGVVADYFPIFVGICKHVTFNDDQRSVVMTGYDRGGVHQTKGEFVSSNITDVVTGNLHVSSAGTHSLGHAPIWGVVWNGNAVVTDGEDYFVNTLNGSIIVPISSRILQFPGSFTYSYQNPFGSMREIIQNVAGIKGWNVSEDNVTIADYTSTTEHPVLSLSDESVIDVCRKFLELSGAKVETNLFPNLRVYSEVQNVINNVNIHVIDDSMIFEDTLIFRADFDEVLNEQTTRSVQKINANVVVGSEGAIAQFSGSQGTTDPRSVQTDVIWWNNFDLSTPTVLVEHRVSKAGLNSISFSASGRFHAALIPFEYFEEPITGASWNSFTDGDDFVIQLKHTIVVLGGGGIRLWTFPAVEYSLTVNGSKINYGDGTIEDVQIVTAQRPIVGISETLKGDVYENPYIETDQHCANICDAILLEHGNPYTASFQIPVFEGRSLNIGDRLNIEKQGLERFYGIIKTLSYSINLVTGQNAIRVGAKGVGIGI
jgi:hypothetical protein